MIALRRSRDSKEATTKATIPGGLATLFTSTDYADMPIYVMTARRIRFLAEFAAQHNAAFVLAGAPQRVEVDPETQRTWMNLDLGGVRPDFDGVRHYLAAVAKELEVASLDPVPAFRVALPHGESFWFHQDPHYTVRGHRLMAEQLANAIEQLPSFQAWKRSPAR
jgi:hypothetical protein